MDPFGNSYQNRIEDIVNNVCREVEQRLQQNEVSPSKCSTSNICEESENHIIVESKLLQIDFIREESCGEEDEEAPYTTKYLAAHHQVFGSLGDEPTLEDLLLEEHTELQNDFEKVGNPILNDEGYGNEVEAEIHEVECK